METGVNKVSKLDDTVQRIRNGERLTKVDLSNCDLTEIPTEIFDLGSSLEFLNLGGNQISTIPIEIQKLTHLKILFFAQNHFEIVPPVLGTLPSLFMLSFKSNKIQEVPDESLSPSIGWLILTDNKIRRIPSSIGKLRGLRKLMLAGNEISDIPIELSFCTELELMRISSNQLNILPPHLLNLPKLSWLAFADNNLWNSNDEMITGSSQNLRF
jgi:Leucine-rich repeat (LRR) protein